MGHWERGCLCLSYLMTHINFIFNMQAKECKAAEVMAKEDGSRWEIGVD